MIDFPNLPATEDPLVANINSPRPHKIQNGFFTLILYIIKMDLVKACEDSQL